MDRYKQMAPSAVFDICLIISFWKKWFLNPALRVILCSMCIAKTPAVDILMEQKVPCKSWAHYSAATSPFASNSCFYDFYTTVNISRTAVACIILGFIILLCIMLLAIYKTNKPPPPEKGSDKPVQGIDRSLTPLPCSIFQCHVLIFWCSSITWLCFRTTKASSPSNGHGFPYLWRNYEVDWEF